MPVDVERLLDAMQQAEDAPGDPDAVSSKGARGLFQIMPETAKQYGVEPEQLSDPHVSRSLARRIVNDHLERYNGDVRKTLIAYNAGPGRVGQTRLPQETRGYLSKILGWLGPDSALAAEPETVDASKVKFAKATPDASPTPTIVDTSKVKFAHPPSGLPPEDESIFSRPTTTGEKIESGIKTAAELSVGVGIPMAAGFALGPEASIPAKIAVQGAAGAVTPYAEAGLARLWGDRPGMPGWEDALKSAAFNAGLTSVGEGVGTLVGKATVVRPEIEAFPGLQSRQTIKQAVRNREFWRRQGLNDTQIDHVLSSPDSQARLIEQIQAGQQTRQAFQAVLDHTRDAFRSRYAQVFGNAAQTPVDVMPLGRQFVALAKGSGQHELTPSFSKFLEDKGRELTQAGQRANLTNVFKTQIAQQGGQLQAPTYNLSLEDLQKLRTELRENVPRGATNLDRQIASQLNDQITQMMEQPLTNDQRLGLRATDADYGRFQDVIKKLDPRGERYGEQVANVLFDPMVSNPGDALNFINMAQEAEQARPGEVMPQLREAFQQKMLTEGRVPGKPFEELRVLRKLQDKWGTDKNMRAVMGAIFGKDTPMANPVTFTKVLGFADNPRSVIDAIGEKPWRWRSILSSPYMQAYAMFGVMAGASGVKGGGLWGSLTGQKGGDAQVLAVASMILSPLIIGKVIGSGNRTLQNAMVNFMTKPEPANMIRYMGALSGATGGGLISLPGSSTTVAPDTRP